MSLETARKKLAAAYAADEISNVDFTEGLAVLRSAEGNSDSDSAATQEEEKQTAANTPELRATVVVEASDNEAYGDVVIRKLVKGGKRRRNLYLWQENIEEVANALLEAL